MRKLFPQFFYWLINRLHIQIYTLQKEMSHTSLFIADHTQNQMIKWQSNWKIEYREVSVLLLWTLSVLVHTGDSRSVSLTYKAEILCQRFVMPALWLLLWLVNWWTAKERLPLGQLLLRLVLRPSYCAVGSWARTQLWQEEWPSGIIGGGLAIESTVSAIILQQFLQRCDRCKLLLLCLLLITLTD